MSKKIELFENLEKVEKEPENTNIIEYEVITDSKVIGQFDYKEYSLMMWERAEMNEGEPRKLSLRVKKKIFNYDDVKDKISKDGYYHGGDVADELLAIASLALRRKFILGNVYRMNNKPMLYSGEKSYKDIQLIKGQSFLFEINGLLDLVEGLNSKYDLKFILAVRLYHKALLLIEKEPDMAYLYLISCIEVLCQDMKIDNIKLDDLDKGLAKLVSSIEDVTYVQG